MSRQRLRTAAMALMLAGGLYTGGSPVEVAGQGAESIVQGVVEAYGGHDQLMAVEAVRLHATMRARTTGQDAAVIRIAEGPSHLKVMIHYPSRVEIRVVDGAKGWRGTTPQNMTEVRGPQWAAMALQAARSNIPWILLEYPITAVSSLGNGIVGLELSPAEDLRLRALVDTDSYHIVASESVLSVGSMEMVFRTEYSDFREFEGLLFAYHEENYAAGTHTASVQIESLQVNPPPNERKLPAGPGA